LIAVLRNLRRSPRWVVLGGLLGFFSLVAVVEPAVAQESPTEDPSPPTPQEAPVELPPEELLPAENITFQLDIPPEKGGGKISGTAGSIEFVREDHVVLEGGFDLRYADIRIQAQRAAIDFETNLVTAEGEVVLDQGPQRLVGATLEFDLETKTGVLTDASAYVDPDFFFHGDRIEKTGEKTYLVNNGLFTSCQAEVPEWSFKMSRAKVTLDGYIKGRNPRLRIKKVPVLWTPYILWPASNERKSGLLMPRIGNSDQRGTSLEMAYYQTLGRSFDTTFFVDLYTSDYLGFGNEFRYRPSETTSGLFQGWLIDDPESEDLRWKVSLNHESSALPFGMRGVVSYTDYSDFEFFRDFERDLRNINLRSIYAYGYLSGNWGTSSLNLLLDDRSTILRTGNEVIQRQLPEIEYKLRPTQLGGIPLYLDLRSSLHYFEIDRTGDNASRYGRGDIFPQLTLPISPAPWLSVALSVGARATWYEDSLDAETGAFTGEALTRTYTTAAANFIGPSFSRIFNSNKGKFGKYKHIIEPRWSFVHLSQYDEQDLVPVFDEVDRIRLNNFLCGLSTGCTAGVFAIVNRVLAKPADEDSGLETREILNLEISQAYSFDSDTPLQSSSDRLTTSKGGPVNIRLRYNPGGRFLLESQLSYSMLFDGLFSTSLTTSYCASGGNNCVVRTDTRKGRYAQVGDGSVMGLTWFKRDNPETGVTRSDQLRFFGGLDVRPANMRFEAYVTYDIENGEIQQQGYSVNFSPNCYGLRVEVQNINVTGREDTQFLFSFSLKNVASFIGLTSGGSGNSR